MEHSRGEGTQSLLKRGDKLGKGVGALKSKGGGGAGTPLRTMDDLILPILFILT